MEENKTITKDGNMVSSYLADMSSKARSVGRNLVYSVIACSWTLSYIDKAFVPTKEIKWALVFVLIYLFPKAKAWNLPPACLGPSQADKTPLFC